MRVSLPLRCLALLSFLLAGFSVGQAQAAPPPEGVNPPRPEQAASVVIESISAGYYNHLRSEDRRHPGLLGRRY